MSDAHAFHALLVGINDYGSEDLNLYCAVPDAESVNKFLMETLHVPQENIVFLKDKEATRDRIISTFRSHLIQKTHIKRNDPILFYFAGHGTRLPESDSGSDDESNSQYPEYEAICPADRWLDEVADIQDTELGDLLKQLADAKGNNVTVIMDCCHSGSGTRNFPLNVDKLRARYAPPLRHTKPLPSIVPDAQGTESRHIKHSLGHPDLTSHVLLAACRSDESAYEYNGKGYFTPKLLDLLEDHTLPRTSYSTLISKIRSFRFPSGEHDSEGQEILMTQTPQCEGKHKDSICFGGKGLGMDKRLVRIRKEDNAVKVEAGGIHGITPGTRFFIQKGFHYSLEPLGQAVAVIVEAVWSYVELLPPTSIASFDDCFARVSYRVDPPYNIAFRTPAPSERQQIVEAGMQLLTDVDRYDVDVHLVRTDANEAKLIATVYDERMELERKSSLITENCDAAEKIAKIPLRSMTGGDGVYDLQKICAAARFDIYLGLENPECPYRGKVKAGLYNISISSGPEAPKDHIVNGCVNLQDDAQAEYSLHLENTSNVDLFAAVYYFDASNHSIQEIYKAPSTTGIPPLGRKRTLRIGSPASGSSPLFFFLAEGEVRDTGFLKVFLSECYAELAMIEQEEGFTPFPQSQDGNGRSGALNRDAAGSWDTITIVVNVHHKLPETDNHE